MIILVIESCKALIIVCKNRTIREEESKYCLEFIHEDFILGDSITEDCGVSSLEKDVRISLTQNLAAVQ